MTRPITFLLFLTAAMAAAAQSVTFADDLLDRGYTERPYLRYEAEEGFCSASGAEFVTLAGAAEFTQESIAAEASNLSAAVLTGKGSSLAWILDAPADALTIRFSIPDSDDGTGTRRTIYICDGTRRVGSVELDSRQAWQYTVKRNVSEKYPDNTPSADKFARMRFDEARVLLPELLPAGAKLRLEVAEEGADPVTIDFVEAEEAGEPLPAPEGAVIFEGDGSKLQGFINKNPGRTIYIPAGRYEISNTLTIGAPDTRLAGAGMWHTELYFTAAPDNNRTYGRRGVKCSADNCGLSDLALNTVNDRRYYLNNPSYQTGKGLMGSWGKGSVIRSVLVEHFECGAWIADYDGNPSTGLTVTGCRFRNNYADGINLCSGTTGARVSQCSFRNNGDDDMASWSTGHETADNLFDHCTAENNWRASSLGFFGGRGNRASNIAVYDAMEGGVRVNADFNGTGFAADSRITVSNVSIRRSGTGSGSCGVRGDFWGNAQPALLVSAGYFYDVANLTLSNIDIYDCRYEGVRVRSGSGKKVTGLVMTDITVHNQTGDGLAFDFAGGLRGDGTGSGLSAEGCAEPWMSAIPPTFDFTLTSGIDGAAADGNAGEIAVEVCGRCVTVTSAPSEVRFFDAAGAEAATACEGETVGSLRPGIYILAARGCRVRKIALL